MDLWVILQLSQNVTLSAIAMKSAWPVLPPLPSYGQGRDYPGPRYSSLIHGEHLVNVTIQGSAVAGGRSSCRSSSSSSTLGGQGAYWWDLRNRRMDQYTRGHLVEFLYSRQIQLYHLCLQDSPFWTTHFYASHDIHVKHVHVQAPLQGAPNTDGFDPDSCTNVLIEDSSYRGGDDCVAIKSGWDCFGQAFSQPTVNVTIRNVTCHGRSEMSGGVENILIENSTFTMANHAANIKVGNTRGGYIRNVTYRNIHVNGNLTGSALHVDMFHFYNQPNPSCPTNWHPSKLPQISHITFDNINGQDANLWTNETYHFVGMKQSPIQNLFMSNVHFPGNVVHHRNDDDDDDDAAAVVPSWNCSAVQGVVVQNSARPWPPCPELTIVVPVLGSTITPSLRIDSSRIILWWRINSIVMVVVVVVLLLVSKAFCLSERRFKYSTKRFQERMLD